MQGSLFGCLVLFGGYIFRILYLMRRVHDLGLSLEFNNEFLDEMTKKNGVQAKPSRISALLKKKKQSREKIIFLGQEFYIEKPNIIDLQALNDEKLQVAQTFATNYLADSAESLKKQRIDTKTWKAILEKNPDAKKPKNKYEERVAHAANSYHMALMVCELLKFPNGEAIIEGATTQEIDELQHEILSDLVFFNEFAAKLQAMFAPPKNS